MYHSLAVRLQDSIIVYHGVFHGLAAHFETFWIFSIIFDPKITGAPLHGEPRLAMLLAERGSPWVRGSATSGPRSTVFVVEAELCSEACREMAKAAAPQRQPIMPHTKKHKKTRHP